MDGHLAIQVPAWWRKDCGGLSFVFVDFRDSRVGRQAHSQASTLTVWEVMLPVRSYKYDARAVAKHLRWPEAKVHAAVHYARAYPQEIEEAITENEAMVLEALQRMLPQTSRFISKKSTKD
jgi:hypothetical protein